MGLGAHATTVIPGLLGAEAGDVETAAPGVPPDVVTTATGTALGVIGLAVGVPLGDATTATDSLSDRVFGIATPDVGVPFGVAKAAPNMDLGVVTIAAATALGVVTPDVGVLFGVLAAATTRAFGVEACVTCVDGLPANSSLPDR